MKLKIFENTKHMYDQVHIGKTGQIRFKKPFVELLGIKKGDYLLVGTDEDDSDNKYLYIILCDSKDLRGFKVMNGNGSYFISGKGVSDKIGIETPKSYRYEKFADSKYKGVRLILKQHYEHTNN